MSFKAGDKVKIVREGEFTGNINSWTADMRKCIGDGHVYTLSRYASGQGGWFIRCELDEDGFVYPESAFEKVPPTITVGMRIRHPMWVNYYPVLEVSEHHIRLEGRDLCGRYPRYWCDWQIEEPLVQPTEPPKVDWTKPVQTRGGLPAKVVAILDKPLKCGSTVIATVSTSTGDFAYSYHANGRHNLTTIPSPYDLVNVPPETSMTKTFYMRQRASDGKLKWTEHKGVDGPIWKIVGKKTVTINIGEGV